MNKIINKYINYINKNLYLKKKIDIIYTHNLFIKLCLKI